MYSYFKDDDHVNKKAKGTKNVRRRIGETPKNKKLKI